MAMRFVDSFDHYVTADLATKYEVYSGATISSGNGRFATDSVRFTSTSHAITKVLDSQATWIVGFAMRLSSVTGSGNVFLTFIDSATTHVDLRTNTSGNLVATRNGTTLGTSTQVFSNNTYHYIEVKVTIADAAGVVSVYVDGVQWLNLTSQDTRNGANASADRIRFGSMAVSSITLDIDDLVIMDTTGGVNDDFIGEVRVKVILPDGAGNSAQFTPSAGSNYQNVDDAAPDSDTTYNESSTTNHIDSFTYQNPGLGATVLAVQWNGYARKTDAGTRQIAPHVRISSTDYTGSTLTLASSYTQYRQVYDVSPATAIAWTESEIDGAEFGVKVIA